MALKPCRECGAKISTEAAACPQCGARPKKSMGPVGRLLLGFIVLAVVIRVFSPGSTSSVTPETPKPVRTPEQIAAEKAKEARFQRTLVVVKTIKESLRDPESVKWRNILSNEDASVVCVEYRARNGFGGVNLDHVVYAKQQLSTTNASWNRYCAKKELYDMQLVGKVVT